MRTPIRASRKCAAHALLAASLAALLGGAQATTVTVSAHDNWVDATDGSPLDTSIVLSAGEALDITATGTWNGGACGDVGPDGSPCFAGVVPGVTTYSLVGRINSGALFEVGSHLSTTVATGGRLYLGFADVNGFDNSGSVLVTLSAVPEPAAATLMLAGIALLGVSARRTGRHPDGRLDDAAGRFA